ncbi:MAG: FG-GAP repeat protein [Thermoleophilaceae bacterium]|nr:FG-GAP repeat protein [Thermoleophilaceae bacterium]
MLLVITCGTAWGQGTQGQAPLPPPDPADRADPNRIDLRTEANVEIRGIGKDDDTGWIVASAGDVNGDKRDDLIVGARRADPAGRVDAGTAYVIFGRADLGEVDLEKLGAGGFAIAGGAAGDTAGFAVSGAGDVNGDGLGDVVVGAPGADPDGRTGAGMAYVVFGKASADAVDLAALGAGGIALAGAAPHDETGFSVGRVGDLNGDGRADLVVGAPAADPGGRFKAGTAWVVFGGSDAGTFDLGSLGARGFRIDGYSFGYAGWSVNGVDDLNGDGIGEIALGAPFVAAGASRSGEAYVVFGKGGTGDVDLGDLSGRGITIRGGAQNSMLGQSVNRAGDVNGDGAADLIVSALHADPQNRDNAGSAWVIFGGNLAPVVDVSALGQSGFRIEGAATGALTGSFVGAAGDFNDDGLPDVVLGAPGASTGSGVGARAGGGAGYVVFGKRGTDTVDLASFEGKGIQIAGGEAGDRAGRSIAASGDLNGDGVPDVILGAEAAKNGRGVQSGAAFGLFGIDKPGAPGPGKPDKVEIIPPACKPAKNVEAIIDDSGSMSGTDPDNLRVEAMLMLLRKEAHQKTTLGAVDFGENAGHLFFPHVIGKPFTEEPEAFQEGMASRLVSRIRSDGAATNYNAGFELAKKENPKADARIFLTDGAHNEGEYDNSHRGGPPTYVLGFGDSTEGEDGDRLRRIAADTKGKYFPQIDADKLAAAMNSIDARLLCDSKLETWNGRVPKGGGVIRETVLDPATKSADIVLSWAVPAAQFGVTKVEVVQNGQVTKEITGSELAKAYAASRRKARRKPRARRSQTGDLEFAVHRGEAFSTVHLNELPGGATLRFRVRPGKLSRATGLSSQVAQNRRDR